MAEKTTIEIEGREYPFPEKFRLGDPVLVKELSGLTFVEFAEGCEGAEGGKVEPDVMLGLVGVAVWQGNPRWTRAKVRDYVERLDLDKVRVIAPDVEGEERPPVQAGEASSTGSPDDSSVSPEA